MEYLHKVRPVEVMQLESGSYPDKRPFNVYTHTANPFEIPFPHTKFNDLDVILKNGDIHYHVAGWVWWSDVTHWRKSDMTERLGVLGAQIKEYYGKSL